MIKKLAIPLSIVAILCLGLSEAHAAITFDASSQKINGANATTVTSTVAIGTGSNELLNICLVNSAAFPSGVSVTSGAGTVAATFVASTTAGTHAASFWYWLGGNTSAQTVTVSSTMATSSKEDIGLTSFFGVNQSTPVDTTSFTIKSTNAPSSTITTSQSNEMIVDCLGTGNAAGSTTITPNAGQTATMNQTTTVAVAGASYVLAPTAGATSTGWTSSATATDDYLNAALEPFVAPGSTPTYIPRPIVMAMDW